ncbi:3-keto-5-aminohexanoate cleavage protein [Saccharopolyspora sp. NFXS83]|uniref:3-keto-5-aminohexanoate cleavage protein n=1 Tax=Saccharopolyspora sp. NFXS83 TaxID=2993560 RepID=UPI00224A55F5|nr:3-keto-5-aminohexanoate cleavage protein [Saccharopolyspora sp. NFXS83]MCX2728723.1 3-keto-5-aminohexanoate cleavage protein [Saccharopolyspora sp. NFXS83]
MTGSPEPTGTVLAVAAAQPGDGTSTSVAEIVRSAAGCARVGAAVVDLPPVPGIPLGDLVATVRERTGLLVRVTGSEATPLPELVDCGAHALSCPLDASPEFVRELRAGAHERGTAVHFLARGSADLAVLREIPDPAHVILVFTGEARFSTGAEFPGSTGSGENHGSPETSRASRSPRAGARGTPSTVTEFASAMELLPRGTGCTAAGVGSAGLPVLLAALAAGAHVRIGRADTPDYAPGTPARDDAQLVARAAGVAKIAQRPPLPPDQAAPALGIKT